MNVLDLARDIDLNPQLAAHCHGGEYQSPCPACGGKDRFRIWPSKEGRGRYWCRRCNKRGDALQFCRDFLGLSFKEACHKVGHVPTPCDSRFKKGTATICPSPSISPLESWRIRAQSLVNYSERSLKNHPEALQALYERGLSLSTIQRFHIGYNPCTSYEPRERWGLPSQQRADGLPKNQWLPKGFVLPTYAQATDTTPIKMKIRREDWSDVDTMPKYVEISGSQSQFSIYGDPHLPIILVESEFDGILLAQEVGDFCCPIALGGASKHPDEQIYHLLLSSPLILFSLDFDPAGKQAYSFWKKLYPVQLKPWPVPKGKSPGDALKEGVNLTHWMLSGVRKYEAPVQPEIIRNKPN